MYFFCDRYYELEVITPGYMQVGWMNVCDGPGKELGIDENSYAFDGFSVSTPQRSYLTIFTNIS